MLRLALTSLCVGCALMLTPAAPAHAQTPPCTANATDSPVDLNHASLDALQALPGIGPTRARAIVEVRERLGGFRSVSQLLRVRGIGRATLRRLRPMVTVTPVRPAPPKDHG